MAKTSYAIALGSNRRSRYGSPAETVRAALERLAPVRSSAVHATPALGPAGRAFANAVAIVESDLEPDELLADLKALEGEFGRRGGRRWGPRVLDLDIILWSGGCWEGSGLVVPHPAFRQRQFVIEPLAELVPVWRDPVSGATVRQLRSILRQGRPLSQPA